MKQKKIRDYGIIIGCMPIGRNNSITDVEGVLVGHHTINDGDIKTGVTAVLPHPGNTFREKVVASSHVINGFGKTAGTIQVEELGTIETPIILTNTLSVGTAYDALVEYMISRNDDIGVRTGTVNPVVCECNDGFLNDIRGRHVKREHVLESIENASAMFDEGAVGAGTGMSCLGLKGGIGSASRIVRLDGKDYTLGVLVLSNFGAKEDLTIDGIKAGKIIWQEIGGKEEDKGSIITIIATDIPLSERQLKRVTKRAAIGLCRTGSFMGNGSGDIVIAFSTANKVKHYEDKDIVNFRIINEDRINDVFRAAAEATEEAVLNSLICSEETVGRDGHVKHSLKDYIYLIKPFE
ncbi:MAG: P1 family peptidase [Caulobacteraceae bacterium]